MSRNFSLFTLIFSLLTSLFLSCQPAAEEPLALQMAESEMARVPESWQLDFKTKLKWDYASGVELEGLLATADYYSAHADGSRRQRADIERRCQALRDYFLAYCDTMVAPDGTIRTYKPQEESLDRIHSAKLFFRAYEMTGDEKYRQALDLVYSQFAHQPRVAEGGFWHKKVYPQQMWLDGLYMGQPFRAQYLATFAPDDQRHDGYADIALQYRVVAAHTYDAVTGLYRHAWDAAHEQPWADPDSGCSPHAWGRAMGWFAMSLVDVLDFIPSSEKAVRTELILLLNDVCDGIVSSQDPESGLWYQVLDATMRDDDGNLTTVGADVPEGAVGNYLESSVSAMFVRTLYKALRMNYISEEFLPIADRGYEAMVSRFVEQDPATGLLSLTQTCAVAGLGGNPYRSGTFDYYIHETVRSNDPKALGPFLNACIEHDLRQQRR